LHRWHLFGKVARPLSVIRTCGEVFASAAF
jgi:hypothetical protein